MAAFVWFEADPTTAALSRPRSAARKRASNSAIIARALLRHHAVLADAEQQKVLLEQLAELNAIRSSSPVLEWDAATLDGKPTDPLGSVTLPDGPKKPN